MNTIGQGLLKFTYDDTRKKAFFVSPDTGLEITENSDFFRIFLDDGDFKEIPVFSSQQKLTSSNFKNGVWELFYEVLIATTGEQYDISLKISIFEQDEGLRFESSINNRDSRIKINEVQCPFLQADSLGEKKKKMHYIILVALDGAFQILGKK